MRESSLPVGRILATVQPTGVVITAHRNDNSNVKPSAQRKMYRIRRNGSFCRFLYRLVQTEVCNISGTSYHKANLLHTDVSPSALKKATCSLALACSFFIYNAHTLIRYAHAHIRIMHSRLYGFLHVRLYGKMHSRLYI